MIIREVRVRELLRRELPDGSISHSALLSFDEAAATTVRLTAKEYDAARAALKAKRPLIMHLAATAAVDASTLGAADGAA